MPGFHYGSHYSAPGLVAQYLIRISPFTEGARAVQGGRFDCADRVFHSLNDSFSCATSEISDVRELTPEFFCFPEFLLNLEQLDFGV